MWEVIVCVASLARALRRHYTTTTVRQMCRNGFLFAPSTSPRCVDSDTSPKEESSYIVIRGLTVTLLELHSTSGCSSLSFYRWDTFSPYLVWKSSGVWGLILPLGCTDTGSWTQRQGENNLLFWRGKVCVFDYLRHLSLKSYHPPLHHLKPVRQIVVFATTSHRVLKTHHPTTDEKGDGFGCV